MRPISMNVDNGKVVEVEEVGPHRANPAFHRILREVVTARDPAGVVSRGYILAARYAENLGADSAMLNIGEMTPMGHITSSAAENIAAVTWEAEIVVAVPTTE